MKKIILLLTAGLFCFLACSAPGNQGDYYLQKGNQLKIENLKEGQNVKLFGRLRMVGSAPFSEMVLTTSDNVDLSLIYKSERQQKKIQNLQYKIVCLQGVLFREARYGADGKFVSYQYFLKVKKIKKL